MKYRFPPYTTSKEFLEKETCLFRGLVMSNPFTIACPDRTLGLMLQGHTFDGEFLIIAYRWNNNSLHAEERTGALTVRWVGPISDEIYPPVGEWEWMRLRLLSSPYRPFPVKAEIRAARRLRAMAFAELARRKGGVR